MLLQQITKCFVGEFLERFHVVGREHLKFLPRLVMKLHAFANHGSPRKFEN